MNQSFPEITPILNSVGKIIAAGKLRSVILQEISELLASKVDHYDWVGFYLADDSGKNLILGPYVGAATDHMKIAFGKGICGEVAVFNLSRIIQDVSLEDNYLSCGSSVRSEVVFPIMRDGKFVGELDIDSHALAPFGEADTKLLESICQKLEVLF